MLGKKIILRSLFLLYATGIHGLSSQEAIQIGTSSIKHATKGNHARKIVRTSDDRLAVIYTEGTSSAKPIKYTVSHDHIHWTPASQIGTGTNPAVTIGPNNQIYALWSTPEGNIKIVRFTNNLQTIDNSITVPVNKNNYNPVAEATANYLHLIWIENDEVHYCRLSLDLCQILIPPTSVANGYRATIAGDLEYEDGLLHIVGEHALYFSMLSFSEHEDFHQMLTQDRLIFLDQFKDCLFPSLSVRSYYSNPPGYYSHLILTCSNSVKRGFFVSAIDLTSRDWQKMFFDSEFYPTTSQLAVTSVDDIYDFFRSCAIVWQDSTNIYYGQAEDEHIITNPPILVNDSLAGNSYYPSICYKTYRPDSFDVVWTQGNSAPYKIMYRRMAKTNYKPPSEFEITTADLKTGTFRKPYYQKLEVKPNYSHIIWESDSGQMPEGVRVTWRQCIEGIPEQSGEFQFSITATSRSLPDFPAWSDTASYTLTIINSAPQIVSADTVTGYRGQEFHYQAQAQDPEENTVVFQFRNYPAWLSPDSSTIHGMIPNLAPDTSFSVIASDGELADTLQVQVKISEKPLEVISTKASWPRQFHLLQNYPNPFNAETRIDITVPIQQNLSLAVFNLNGTRIETIYVGALRPGHYSFSWQVQNLPSGTYFIVLEAGDFKEIRKCVFLK